ncbi:MAG: sensor histidine kinase [Ktedonobacterales bacterium]
MRHAGQDNTTMTASAWSVRTTGAEASREVVPPALWRVFVLIWLLFLYYPLLTLLLAHPARFQLVITVAGAALFVVLYLRLALPLPFGTELPVRMRLRTHSMPLALALLLAADVMLLTLLASLDWLWFFIFVSIAFGVRLPPRPAAVAVAATTALTIAVGIGAFGWVYTLRIALPVAVVGLGMIGVGRLVATIRELRAAREEIARLAVAEERLRFARDLHDLLGHSLSTITLKNEVACSLIPTHPDRAVHELADAISLAREALREVRQAVSGYRQPTLLMEIRSAQALLEAAGITCSVGDTTGVTDVSGATWLPPTLEAVLAWTVREGVTNVVRYSGARHCAIAVVRHADAVAVEITDDGEDGRDAASLGARWDIPGRVGAGLRGLAERAAQVHGQVEAGPRKPSGFRLRVTVPLPGPFPFPPPETPPADTSADHPSEQRIPQS